MSFFGVFQKQVVNNIYAISKEILREMIKNGADTNLATQLMVVQMVGDKIINTNYDDIPKVLDEITDEFDDDDIIDYYAVNSAVIRICEKFNFFYKLDSNGIIPKEGISFYNSRFNDER